jgi:S-(hydroxymethyl)glutathione dehydrogenase/alcohol dehydrogenase
MRSRAAVYFGQGRPVEVCDVEIGEPGPEEVVVKMAAVGICGTDLHQLRGEWTRPTPMVLGHEGSGVVEAVGDAVPADRLGTRVVISWADSCGQCADCNRGRPAACTALHRAIGAGTRCDGSSGVQLDGAPIYIGTATGAFAERLILHQRRALPLDDEIGLEEAALLGCAALTGVGAVQFVARDRPIGITVVIGLGGVGQFCVQAARLRDADIIIGADPVPTRRDRALTLGATHAVAPSELDALVGSLAPDGADLALDVVGSAEATRQALRLTRSGGVAVVVGLPAHGEQLTVDFAQFTRREKWLTGTMYGSEDPAVALPALMEHAKRGELDLTVGPHFSLDAINAAIAASMAGAASRVLVFPNGEPDAW